jgi:hypothetical protein
MVTLDHDGARLGHRPLGDTTSFKAEGSAGGCPTYRTRFKWSRTWSSKFALGEATLEWGGVPGMGTLPALF